MRVKESVLDERGLDGDGCIEDGVWGEDIRVDERKGGC